MASLKDTFERWSQVQASQPTAPISAEESANLATPEELDTLAARLKKKRRAEQAIPASPDYLLDTSAQSVKEKEPAMPAPPPVGGDVSQKTPTDEATLRGKIGQAQAGQKGKPAVDPADVGEAMKTVGQFQAQLAGKTNLSDKQLKSYLDELDTISDKLKTQPLSVDTAKFQEARANAYQAYKDKASRNEWLEIAQDLVNSVTQFASAKAAMGTRFEGGVPLKGIDYAGRTARAAKEYEMEMGQVGSEEREALTAQERADRLRREETDLSRRTLEDKIAAERERLREESGRVERAGSQAVSLFNTLNADKRADERNQMELQKKTMEIEQRGRTAATGELSKHIKSLEEEEKSLTARIKAANQLSVAKGKDYDKALANFATTFGMSEQEVKDRADRESGFFTLDKTYVKDNIAKGKVDELAPVLKNIQDQISRLRPIQIGTVAPTGTSAPTQPAPSTAPSVGDNMVTVQLSTGKQGRIPANQLNKFLQDNPGSRQVQ